ncbi:hypothetical protein L0B53_13675 [Vibrio sp. SS-MA-C1-2]|uniref:hypothetical protein n=1 Tax=Vibrio sp. SS-MA-C1-2 TaxID=2908646 RepID=UPI001F27CDCB|nr:hypothetical protein [Vibrio sp. SS-MA-C1-2]UJF18066.1 hypothetical protein L0B53_13675 [Vibrio sp. SS-MA-C1-2]
MLNHFGQSIFDIPAGFGNYLLKNNQQVFQPNSLPIYSLTLTTKLLMACILLLLVVWGVKK